MRFRVKLTTSRSRLVRIHFNSATGVHSAGTIVTTATGGRTGERGREGGREAKRGRPLRMIEEEHRFWAKERVWIEAQDVALVEALERLSRLIGSSSLVTNQRASQKGEA